MVFSTTKSLLVTLFGSAFVTLSTSQGLVPITYSGYVVDFYCYSLVENGGVALDGSDVIVRPMDHTLHCLRDIPQCREGFYLAEKQGDKYRIKFKLDDASYNNILALMDQFPKGSDRDNQFFAVSATGMHNGNGVLQGATFQTCFEFPRCDSVCNVIGGTCDTPPNLDYTLRVPFLLVAHVVCMCLSWGCLLPFGVLCARHLRMSSYEPLGKPVWFQGHRLLQSVGVLLQLLGLVFIMAFKKSAHFKLPHEIIGLVVVVLGILQPVNAQIRNLECVGHPKADGTKTVARQIWEYVHKGCGITAVLLGIVNVILGPIHADNLHFDNGLAIGAAIWVGFVTGTLVIAGIVLEIRLQLNTWKKVSTEESSSRSSDGGSSGSSSSS